MLPAWMLPLAIVLALGGLFAAAFRDRLLPAVPVHVTPALLLADLESKAPSADDPNMKAASDMSPTARKMLFQAGGWLEPDPLPIYASVLTDGVISKVHVLEGEEVEKGQILAELISEDAQIALNAAVQARERAAAELRLQQVQVTVAEADAEAMGDQVKAAEAKLAEEHDNQARISRIPAGSISDQERTRSKFAVEGQVAEVAARKSQHTAALAKVRAAGAQAAVLEAALAAAQVEVEKNKLTLTRTKIHSPVAGVILELHAAPGQKKILAMDDHQSATVATLFEKGKLQARVDVPLADARSLVTGQEVLITSDFLPNKEFRGEVSRIVGAANLQRNTLQAKVRVLDPDPRLRPEMLCRVKFLEPTDVMTASSVRAIPGHTQKTADDDSRAIFVPEEAVISAGTDATLWVVDPNGVSATSRTIILGTLKLEEHIAVSSGVLPGELIIMPPHDHLSDGRRVNPHLPVR